MDGFLFDGRQQTASALNRQYPALSKGRWQTVLERGCKTLAEAMAESARMDYAGQHARVLAGRKAARMPETRITVVRRAAE